MDADFISKPRSHTLGTYRSGRFLTNAPEGRYLDYKQAPKERSRCRASQGTAGLLAGLGLLAIPGLGPVVAAGWLAATAVGAAAGAATGGIVGALTEAGVSEADAHSYAEGVRRGGTLVSARIADADRSRLDTVLNESAVNLRDRSAAWQKTGWKSFDAGSKPYGAEEVRKERALYGGGLR